MSTIFILYRKVANVTMRSTTETVIDIETETDKTAKNWCGSRIPRRRVCQPIRESTKICFGKYSKTGYDITKMLVCSCGGTAVVPSLQQFFGMSLS